MLIVIAIIVIAALGGVIMFLYSRLTRIKGELFAANRDASRARARTEAAKKAASEAQERCKQLVAQLNNSIASTGQALSIAKHIEYVSQQLGELIGYIAPWAEAEVTPGRHAALSSAVPEAEPYELPETYTRELPHVHVDHQNGSEVSIANGIVHYISQEGYESQGA